MKNCDFNLRQREFKKMLRAYHDSINRGNRYNLSKIAGKLNVFESDDEEDGEVRGNDGVDSEDYTFERKIPNTGLTVLKRGEMYAIGDIDKMPITEFKYLLVQGCLGEHNKLVRCITDDGKTEDFDVESETIVEDANGGVAGNTGDGGSISGIGVSDVGCGGSHKDHSEIDYLDVKEQLTIPYLCGTRVVDVMNGRRPSRRRKKRRRS